MRKNAWRACLILAMTTLLGACQMDRSSTVKIICPTIKSYDKATLDRALQEYRLLPNGSAIKRLIGDYQQLRDKVRACRGQ